MKRKFFIDHTPPAIAVAEQISPDDAIDMIQTNEHNRCMELEELAFSARHSFYTHAAIHESKGLSSTAVAEELISAPLETQGRGVTHGHAVIYESSVCFANVE